MIKVKSNYICVVVHNYFPYTETRALRQIEALLESDFKIDVICLRNSNDVDYERIGKINIYRLPVNYKRNNLILRLFNIIHFFTLAFIKLNRLSRKKEYALIHIHTHINFLIFIGILQKIKGTPLILDMHDLLPEFFKGRFQDSYFKNLFKLANVEERISCRFANHIIVVTEEARKVLIKRRIRPDKVSVVMNLADNNYFTENASNVKNHKPGLDLLYYGSFIWFYGLDNAIEGFSKICTKYREITMHIIGEGHQKEYLEELVKKNNLEDNVKILDPIKPEEISSLINENTVGILPSIFNYHTEVQLPTKLLEYAAMGLPVICSRIPILENYFTDDMIEFSEPGSSSDFGSSIVKLYNSQNRRNELSQNILKFNSKYNWEFEKKNLINTYHNVVKAN